MESSVLPLQTVVRRTGLSGHVLRAWERRYRAVRPARSRSGQRRYTEADVQRLLLLKRATQAGHPIGTVATESDVTIRRLLAGDAASASGTGAALEETLRRECVTAVQALNQRNLTYALDNAVVQFGLQGLLRRIVAPVAEVIGELWRSGEITVAQEHFFTAVVRTFLGNSAQQFACPVNAPALVAATPAGQLHELGAFLAAVAAAHLGWRAIYLGCSLPAQEIAAAVIQVEARVLALSIIHPPDDTRLPAELRMIRRRLPDVNLIVGGRAAYSYRGVLKSINARVTSDLVDLGDHLDTIRARYIATE